MIAVCLTIYFLLSLTFITALAFAASRPTPQINNLPHTAMTETHFQTDQVELHDAA